MLDEEEGDADLEPLGVRGVQKPPDRREDPVLRPPADGDTLHIESARLEPAQTGCAGCVIALSLSLAGSLSSGGEVSGCDGGGGAPLAPRRAGRARAGGAAASRAPCCRRRCGAAAGPHRQRRSARRRLRACAAGSTGDGMASLITPSTPTTHPPLTHTLACRRRRSVRGAGVSGCTTCAPARPGGAQREQERLGRRLPARPSQEAVGSGGPGAEHLVG